jgi:hypothetical protein
MCVCVCARARACVRACKYKSVLHTQTHTRTHAHTYTHTLHLQEGILPSHPSLQISPHQHLSLTAREDPPRFPPPVIVVHDVVLPDLFSRIFTLRVLPLQHKDVCVCVCVLCLCVYVCVLSFPFLMIASLPF